jgi:hypothetical protein
MASKNGFSYDEWLKICKSHYSVDPVTFTVTSLASGPQHLKTWTHGSEISAQEHVFKLMNYMHYNHYERAGVSDTIEFRYIPEATEDKK